MRFSGWIGDEKKKPPAKQAAQPKVCFFFFHVSKLFMLTLNERIYIYIDDLWIVSFS